MLPASSKPQVLIFDYQDFGPQVSVYESIGFEWWQWDSHGDGNPNTQYPIKVVVYKGELKDVKSIYPVNPSEFQDYRYLECRAALQLISSQVPNPKRERTQKQIRDFFKI